MIKILLINTASWDKLFTTKETFFRVDNLTEVDCLSYNQENTNSRRLKTIACSTFPASF